MDYIVTCQNCSIKFPVDSLQAWCNRKFCNTCRGNKTNARATAEYYKKNAELIKAKRRAKYKQQRGEAK